MAFFAAGKKIQAESPVRPQAGCARITRKKSL
jgi:hypothetical protein